MPTLRPTISRYWSRSNGSLTIAMSRSANAPASSAVTGPDISTAYSSPPKRATMSPPGRERDHLLQPPRNRHQQPVAIVVAERVVHALEAVEIEEEHGAAFAARTVAHERLFELLLEAVAVRQPRQRVEAREIGDPLLRLAALGHIDEGQRGDDAVGKRMAFDADAACELRRRHHVFQDARRAVGAGPAKLARLLRRGVAASKRSMRRLGERRRRDCHRRALPRSRACRARGCARPNGSHCGSRRPRPRR